MKRAYVEQYHTIDASGENGPDKYIDDFILRMRDKYGCFSDNIRVRYRNTTTNVRIDFSTNVANLSDNVVIEITDDTTLFGLIYKFRDSMNACITSLIDFNWRLTDAEKNNPI